MSSTAKNGKRVSRSTAGSLSEIKVSRAKVVVRAPEDPPAVPKAPETITINISTPHGSGSLLGAMVSDDLADAAVYALRGSLNRVANRDMEVIQPASGTLTGRISSRSIPDLQQITRSMFPSMFVESDTAARIAREIDLRRVGRYYPEPSIGSIEISTPAPESHDLYVGQPLHGVTYTDIENRELDRAAQLTEESHITVERGPSRAERRGQADRPGMPGQNRMTATEARNRQQQAAIARRGASRAIHAAEVQELVNEIQYELSRRISSIYLHSRSCDAYIGIAPPGSATGSARTAHTASITSCDFGNMARGLLARIVQHNPSWLSLLARHLAPANVRPHEIRDLELMTYGSYIFILVSHGARITILRAPEVQIDTAFTREFSLRLPIFQEAAPRLSHALFGARR